MKRRCVLALTALLAANGTRAAECVYVHPEVGALAKPSPRLLMLPPRAEIVDAKGSVVADPGGLADSVSGAVHSTLETSGFDVDGHSLGAEAVERDAELRILVDRAWDRFDTDAARTCIPDTSLDTETLTISDVVVPLAAPRGADALIFVHARTLVRSKGFRTFMHALKAVAPDATWPGPKLDVTWVEVAIADGRTGRILALSAVAEEGDMNRHPASVIANAVERVLADLPQAAESPPTEPSRVIHDTPALRHWVRATGAGLGSGEARSRDELALIDPTRQDGEVRLILQAPANASGARIVLSRRQGAPGLMVVNETSHATRVSASLRSFLELQPGDLVLLDVDATSPWLVVTDAAGTELVRADCADAAAARVQARILPP